MYAGNNILADPGLCLPVVYASLQCPAEFAEDDGAQGTLLHTIEQVYVQVLQ